MRYILIILFLGFSLHANIEIAKHVDMLRSDLEINELGSITASNRIYSEKYGIDYRIALAIFKVESNLNHKAVNYASRDFGIGQINALNMQHYKLDLGEQMTDIYYAVENTYKILKETKDKYKTNSKGWQQWFTRYHSYTPKYRKIYYKLLKPYLKQLGVEK